MMSTLLKLGLSGYDVKPRFGAFQCKYRLQNPLFFGGKNFGDTRHPYEKKESTLDHFGGGVHGKTCWLIAYKVSLYKQLKLTRFSVVCMSNLKTVHVRVYVIIVTMFNFF